VTAPSNAFVRPVIISQSRATGADVALGQVRQFTASAEVVLAAGAIRTPKLLPLTGIGDERRLRLLGIPVAQHLSGVGRNFQNHPACVAQHSRRVFRQLTRCSQHISMY
jgi:choline dehydrogenase